MSFQISTKNSLLPFGFFKLLKFVAIFIGDVLVHLPNLIIIKHICIVKKKIKHKQKKIKMAAKVVYY